MLKTQIDQDLKVALLAGDKTLAMTLRGLKSVILYAEVAKGSREQGLGDEEIIGLLTKEAKKRQESADLYQKGGNEEKANAELAEKKVIEKYLPEQMSEEDLQKIVDDVMKELNLTSMQDMGKLIGAVKAKAGASADGGAIARLVKERLS